MKPADRTNGRAYPPKELNISKTAGDAIEQQSLITIDSLL